MLGSVEGELRSQRKRPNVDAALSKCPTVRSVVVADRCGGEGIEMEAGRDHWWDDAVDNDVAVDAENYTFERTLSTSECTVGQTNIGVILCLGGSSLGFSQATEFAAIVYDHEGNATNFGEPTFTSYTTQAE